jgi:hypothetical protein
VFERNKVKDFTRTKGKWKRDTKVTDCEHDGRLLLDAQQGKQLCRKLQQESKKEEISSILRGKL